MAEWDREIWRKNSIQALKIAFGSCMAIFIAELMQLDYAISAGTIALLSIVTTKWATVRLALARLLSFGFAVLVARTTVYYIESTWVAFGVSVFVVVLVFVLALHLSQISLHFVVH